MEFNKELFSNILSEIYNIYPNQRDFAKKANVNRTYISRYINMNLEVPPSAKILRKLADSSQGITTYQELMKICGYLKKEEQIIVTNNLLNKVLELSENLTVQEVTWLIEILKKSKIKIEKMRKSHE